MSNYTEEAMRTSYHHHGAISMRISTGKIELLHGAMGLCTESAELLDQLKKHFFYGKPFDEVNVKEELGDVFWYCALICHQFGWSFEEVMELNIKKLKKRYPEKFTENQAINRNVEAERIVLEGNSI